MWTVSSFACSIHLGWREQRDPKGRTHFWWPSSAFRLAFIFAFARRIKCTPFVFVCWLDHSLSAQSLTAAARGCPRGSRMPHGTHREIAWWRSLQMELHLWTRCRSHRFIDVMASPTVRRIAVGTMRLVSLLNVRPDLTLEGHADVPAEPLSLRHFRPSPVPRDRRNLHAGLDLFSPGSGGFATRRQA